MDRIKWMVLAALAFAVAAFFAMLSADTDRAQVFATIAVAAAVLSLHEK
jgi:hypothetical protein